MEVAAWEVKQREGWRRCSEPEHGASYSFQHRQDRGHVALGQVTLPRILGGQPKGPRWRLRLQASLEPGGAERGGVRDLII